MYQQIVLIGVPREAVQIDNIGPLIAHLAADAHRGATFEHAVPETAGGLIADQNDAVARIVDILL